MIGRFTFIYSRNQFRKLERKDRRKFGSNIVGRETRDAAEQWQGCPSAIGCTRAIVSLFISEGDPLIQLVLNVAREEIAARSTGAKSPRISRGRLVVPVIDIRCPARIASFWIGVKDARQRKTKLDKSTLPANWSLCSNGRNPVAQ